MIKILQNSILEPGQAQKEGVRGVMESDFIFFMKDNNIPKMFAELGIIIPLTETVQNFHHIDDALYDMKNEIFHFTLVSTFFQEGKV